MNTQTDEPLPNPELEQRLRLSMLDKHNKELDARCWRAAMLIVLAVTAACAVIAFTL